MIQIQNMHLIYSRAKLTIVSAAGKDANAGLPRLRANDVRSYGPITAIRSLYLLPWRNNAVDTSVWNQRAWTLQERIFSTRLLVFTEDTVFGLCSKNMLMEDSVFGGQMQPYQVTPSENRVVLAEDIEPLQDHETFDRIIFSFEKFVGAYTRRSISNDSDRIRAFSGILSVFQPVLADSLWGIPKKVFAQCLQWYGYTESALIRVPEFPSWSWAGWKQGMNLRFMNYKRNVPRTVPLYSCCQQVMLEMIFPVAQHAGITVPLGFPEFEPTKAELEEAQASLSGCIGVPLSHIIVFWAGEASLTVSRQPLKFELFDLIDENGSRFGEITIDPEWRNSQGDKLSFIVFSATKVDEEAGTEEHPSMYVVLPMLIHRVKDVAYRIGIVDRWLRADKWVAQNPHRSLVVLG